VPAQQHQVLHALTRQPRRHGHAQRAQPAGDERRAAAQRSRS
jgi:hypothetical protein